MPNVIAQVARQLSDVELLAAMRRSFAALDEWAAVGVKPDENAELRREYLVARALRAEHRRRTDEVL